MEGEADIHRRVYTYTIERGGGRRGGRGKQSRGGIHYTYTQEAGHKDIHKAYTIA